MKKKVPDTGTFTSSFYLLAAYLNSLNEDVSYLDYSSIHFATGELGTAIRFEFGNFGFALDFLAGYYLHFARTPNFVSYFLAQG